MKNNGADVTAKYTNIGHDASKFFPTATKEYLKLFLGSSFNENGDKNPEQKGKLFMIDQSPYNIKGAHLFKIGFLYVPDHCRENKCPFHIWFHGCASTAGVYGDAAFRYIKILEYASVNNMVVLFPQAWDPDFPYMPHCWAIGTG